VGARPEIAVAGAGLAGLTAAILLARQGARVAVYETYGDPRSRQRRPSQSINLALSHRGLKALDRIGLRRALAPRLVALRGRYVHDGGAGELQPYDLVGSQAIYSVRRRDLLVALVDAAEAVDGVELRFGERCQPANLRRHAMDIVARGRVRRRCFDAIIGADGCYSAIRTAMDEKTRRPSLVRVLDHGYRELPIGAAAARRAGLTADALHIWPRGDRMFVALPNVDGTFTGTVFMPRRGPGGLAALDADGFAASFRRTFPEVAPLVANLDRIGAGRGAGRIVTVRAARWHVDGAALVLGDAAHAMAPFFGQGVNCALEDCVALADLTAASTSWTERFAEFEARRRPQADAIARLSLDNYLQMRHGVVEDGYRLRRAVAGQLQRWFPDRFVPLYAMVAFSSRPYADVLERGAIQERILDRLCRGIDSVSALDRARACSLVVRRLSHLKEVEQ
jgi:kynurenine 3-monooxygenase